MQCRITCDLLARACEEQNIKSIKKILKNYRKKSKNSMFRNSVGAILVNCVRENLTFSYKQMIKSIMKPKLFGKPPDPLKVLNKQHVCEFMFALGRYAQRAEIDYYVERNFPSYDTLRGLVDLDNPAMVNLFLDKYNQLISVDSTTGIECTRTLVRALAVEYGSTHILSDQWPWLSVYNQNGLIQIAVRYRKLDILKEFKTEDKEYVAYLVKKTIKSDTSVSVPSVIKTVCEAYLFSFVVYEDLLQTALTYERYPIAKCLMDISPYAFQTPKSSLLPLVCRITELEAYFDRFSSDGSTHRMTNWAEPIVIYSPTNFGVIIRRGFRSHPSDRLPPIYRNYERLWTNFYYVALLTIFINRVKADKFPRIRFIREKVMV